MEPQQHVFASTVTPQQHVTNPANTVREETLKLRKKIIYALGKVEVAIGCLMTAIGIFTSTYASTYYINNTNYPFRSVLSFGEGIWCGIWVIIAGGLGMGAGARTSTPCLINTHMGFSIVGAIVSGTMCGITAALAGLASGAVAFYFALMSTMSFVSLATTVLLIVSASYCCCANPAGCCGQQTYPRGPTVPMSQYINTPGVAPVQAQSGSSIMYSGNRGSAP